MATHPYARLKFRTVDPTVNEDAPSYEVGDIWINETSGEPFICVDNTNGAAVWVSLEGGSFDLAAAILAATLDSPVTDDLFIFRQDSSGELRKADGDALINGFIHPSLLTYFADIIHSHGPGDNQIAHADLSGLSGDDHTQYTRHNLSTAANDFLVGSGSSSWIKKTLAETITILRTSLDSIFAPIAKGVTNGDSHDHNGGDGSQIAYSSLSGALTQAAGTYAPTFTAVANISATSAVSDFAYMRLGNIVIGGGNLNADAVSAGVLAQIRISIPVASNFTSSGDLTGTGGIQGSDDVVIAAADVSNDAIDLAYTPNGTANTVIRVLFIYIVK